MKKVLITGSTGFAGSYLGEHILSTQGNELYGTYVSEASLSHVAAIKDKIQTTKVNLLDAAHVLSYIGEIRPDEIYHLAALPFTASSHNNPSETMINNITSQVNLFEAVVQAELPACRILITSSADIYGKVAPSDLPIDENTPLMPTNPYSVSKIAQDYLGLQYFLSQKLQVIRVRPFNHIGPRQSPQFVVAAFAKQIAEIEKGSEDPVLKVGNLDAKKDFTDVRDMVRAYVLLMEKGEAGDVYNIGSGQATQIKEILHKMLSFAKKTIAVQKDPERYRPNEIPEFYCDSTKMQTLTGWSPEITLEKSLEDTLNYWREQE